ncbi:hypothetical protein [Peribacillus asahii]|uniref:hypothetical protein n=1 Tax=Peribacillus asahii TaxID=228899 RepID=UPI00207AF082|nr:hypothetical protein [Peribacillus asahii]USK62176.1 hypothetical protein LIT37_23655 [Peribacillus asahii]
MMKAVFNRYVSNEPSTYLIIGLMTMTTRNVILTGEEAHTFDGRMGCLDEPVDVTPFLENVPVIQV